VIIFDEPTSSLSQHETEHFYTLLDRLKARDVTCVFVSHRMQEIFRLCDTITVLRDGRHVATKPIGEVDEAALVQLMIGRRLEEYLPDDTPMADGGEVLRVTELASPRKFAGISFSVRGGEVLGIAGLVGAGRTDIAHAIFGLDPEDATTAGLSGGNQQKLVLAKWMRAGVGFVPEDRKRHGLVLSMRALENVTLPTLRSIARAGWLRVGGERAIADDAFARLRVRTPDLDATTAGLSGGNQQKLVLAKWLAARCRVLILDEPTRGVDVGAKAEIHALIGRLAAEGTGIVLISSELPELVSLSSRVLVLRDGRLVGELARAEATPASVLRMMAGLEPAGPRLRA
jgi:ABC-type sugar transport system ATPase subunit